MTTGTCLCGTVRFKIIPPAIAINNCHCSLCRKASGGAFGSYLHIPVEQFEWLHGADNINNFIPDGCDPRPFCRTCGSRVPIKDDDEMIIPAGLLDGDPELKVAVNIFTASKADWYEIADGLPTFEKGAGTAFWEPFYEAYEKKK